MLFKYKEKCKRLAYIILVIITIIFILYNVFINGEKVFSKSFKHPFTFVWERFYRFDLGEGEKEIRITLEDETDVNLLRGVILMGSTKESVAIDY